MASEDSGSTLPPGLFTDMLKAGLKSMGPLRSRVKDLVQQYAYDGVDVAQLARKLDEIYANFDKKYPELNFQEVLQIAVVFGLCKGNNIGKMEKTMKGTAKAHLGIVKHVFGLVYKPTKQDLTLTRLCVLCPHIVARVLLEMEQNSAIRRPVPLKAIRAISHDYPCLLMSPVVGSLIPNEIHFKEGVYEDLINAFNLYTGMERLILNKNDYGDGKRKSIVDAYLDTRTYILLALNSKLLTSEERLKVELFGYLKSIIVKDDEKFTITDAVMRASEAYKLIIKNKV